jgi:hypothetical protein
MCRRLIVSAILTSLLSILLTATTPAQQHQLTVSDVVKASIDSVVLIVVSDENGRPTAEGSGFIASPDGKIVTNHHVIAGAHSAIAKLNNGAFFAVDGVLSDDPEHDIAVIKVTGKNLPYLTLAATESISVGDHVVAIGSPLGFENSVSDGIVSSFREDDKGHGWIQTTAPASHGNSGGPLLTMDAKVAGVVTWKANKGENLNFAVPSNIISASLTNSNLQPLGARAGSPVSSEKGWKREEVTDPLRGTAFTQFSLIGRFLRTPSNSESSPMMIVRCIPGKNLRGKANGKFASGYIYVGGVLDTAVLGGGASAVNLRYRLDDGKVQSDAWGRSTNFSSIFMSHPGCGGLCGGGYDLFANLLYGHRMYHKENTSPQVRKVVLEVPEFLGGEIVMQFDLPDSSEVADTCGIIIHK